MKSLLKYLTPRSLFGRALIILILPIVLVQLVSAYIFYNRHWESVQRHMAIALAGEIAFLAQEIAPLGYNKRLLVAHEAKSQMDLDLRLTSRTELSDEDDEPDMFPTIRSKLREKMEYPFGLRENHHNDDLVVSILLDGTVVEIIASRKRIASPTTYIFILWMTGSSLFFLLIAILFLRNQIRPITRLAAAAERFGRGQDTPDFRPHGAREVRQAAQAFLIMKERIRRQIDERAEMLAAVSHDLRTPLTRMKLQLAMFKGNPDADALASDVQDMEHMIEEYLDFVRGEDGEKASSVNLKGLVEDILHGYARQGHDIPLQWDADILHPELRIIAFKRCLTNLIDNALRYGEQASLSVKTLSSGAIRILIDDHGPGIPADAREQAFRPFTRLDTSRNLETGGTGLGLAIAKDVVLSHGGTIALEESPSGGLRVRITLPGTAANT